MPIAKSLAGGGRADQGLWQASISPSNAVFAHLEAIGFNLHMEKNLGKYIRYRNFMDYAAAERQFASMGIPMPANFWGKAGAASAGIGSIIGTHPIT